MPCDVTIVDPTVDLLAVGIEFGWAHDLAAGLTVPLALHGRVVAELVPVGHLPRRARVLVEARRLSRSARRGLADVVVAGHCVAVCLDGRIVGMIRPRPAPGPDTLFSPAAGAPRH